MVRCCYPSYPGHTPRISHALICDFTLPANTTLQAILNHPLPFLRTVHSPDRCHHRRHSSFRATRRSHLHLWPQHLVTIPTNNHSRRDRAAACLYLQCSALSPRNTSKSPTTITEPHRAACRSHLLLDHPPHLVLSCPLPHILRSRVSQSIRTSHDPLLQKDLETIHRTDTDLLLAP